MNDLISREALKKDFEERNKACDKWIANAKDEETKIRADATKNFICEVIMTINNTPSVEPEKPIRCKDCKHQKKCWHEDKRMKDKGYWIYGCELIDDSFVGTPVWGGDNQFCSSAKKKGSAE